MNEAPILSSAEGRTEDAEDEESASLLLKTDDAEASHHLAKARTILRAYCGADASVRKATLDAMSTIEYDTSNPVTKSSSEQARTLQEMHAWAHAHSVESLTKVLMAFKLNAFSFGDHGSALFPTIRLMEHSCDSNVIYAPRPSGTSARASTRALPPSCKSLS